MLSDQVKFYFVFQLKIVEQEVVRSQSFTRLENRTLLSYPVYLSQYADVSLTTNL